MNTSDKVASTGDDPSDFQGTYENFSNILPFYSQFKIANMAEFD